MLPLLNHTNMKYPVGKKVLYKAKEDKKTATGTIVSREEAYKHGFGSLWDSPDYVVAFWDDVQMVMPGQIKNIKGLLRDLPDWF